MTDYRTRFLRLALERGALQFGEFTLKSGRVSPYFFNSGAFCRGADLAELGECFAAAIIAKQLEPDVLFGAAYKGIPLVAATSVALTKVYGKNFAYAFDRKEAKTHGEAGAVVGAPLEGDVVIVDDVLTAGTAMRYAIEFIRRHGGVPRALVVGLDRQERGESGLLAAEMLRVEYGVAVVPLIRFDDLSDGMLAHAKDAPPGALAALGVYRTDYAGHDGT